MVTEVIQHKLVRIKVPDGKRVSRVRFHSDHPDCRPVEASYPWPHPWWCTGTYEQGVGGQGCVIVAYTENVDLLKKGWPEGRDFEISDGGLEYYTYSDRFQPDDEFIEKNLPLVWGLWAHCGSIHKWQLIVREVRSLLGEGKLDGDIVDSITAPLPEDTVPAPTAADFVIWWMSAQECDSLSRRIHVDNEETFEKWPEYLRHEVWAMGGRPLRGRLWVAAEHMGICPNVPDEYKSRIDDDKGGICLLIRDLKYIRSLPGVVTDHRMNVLETREYLPTGALKSTF